MANRPVFEIAFYFLDLFAFQIKQCRLNPIANSLIGVNVHRSIVVTA